MTELMLDASCTSEVDCSRAIMSPAISAAGVHRVFLGDGFGLAQRGGSNSHHAIAVLASLVIAPGGSSRVLEATVPTANALSARAQSRGGGPEGRWSRGYLIAKKNRRYFASIWMSGMAKSTTTDVLICGAGAAGLSLAIDLARRGVNFRLIEKSETPFQGSRGKGVQPRTQEVFEDYGILDRLYATGGMYPPIRQYAPDGSFEDAPLSDALGPTPAEP